MRFGVLALLATVAKPQFVYAQSPDCTGDQSRSAAAAENIKITIANVEFSGENPLSNDARIELLNRIKQLKLGISPGKDDRDWLAEVEAPILEALQKEGYFQAHPESTPYLIRAEVHERIYVVNVGIDSGPQYRLGEIHFSGETVFATTELRAQFSLRAGDLFDVPKFRKGMESMARIYSGKGYIDLVTEPEFEMVAKLKENTSEKSPVISVLIKVDEGRQYHVRAVEVLGLDQQMEQGLKSQLGPGRVVDAISLWNFFEEHKAALPANISPEEAIHLRRDFANASVDFFVDFRPCPQT